MKLLHIDSSILGDHSGSRQVTAAAVQTLKDSHPGVEVIYRDLVAAPLPHLTLAHLPTDHPMAVGVAPTDLSRQSQSILEEFLAADTVVIGAPMYNFTIPSQLKTWIDRILVAGKTFKYGANGPEGLVGGKRIIVAVVRGGVYAAGSPSAAAEHVESYLRAVLGFIGVINPQFIIAEGVAMGPEARDKAIKGAIESAQALTP